MESAPTAPARLAYILCELKSRDFESGLLIAKRLLALGVPVVLGQRWSIVENLVRGAPRGAVLFRTCNVLQLVDIERCTDHVIIAMDEEGLPFAGDAFLDNLDARALKRSAVFCAQDDRVRRIVLERFPGTPVRVTGSPRIDLLKTGTWEKQPGPYVLFNTNFALTNSVWGDTHGAVSRVVAGTTIDPNSPEGRAEIQTRLDFEEATKAQLLALIRWLAPQYPVVVRPHPAENASAWNAIPGIRVIAGSNPIPWILGATVTVHSNSTTGLEAAILERPCINISPPQFDAWTARFAMRAVNTTVPDAQTAIPLLTAFIQGKAATKAKMKFLPGAAGRIAETMADHVARGELPQFGWKSIPRIDAQRAKFNASVEELALPATVLDDSVFLLRP